MGDRVRTPEHVKFRREDDCGLVYEHDNYGYEDASLYEVSEVVVDVLEYVGDGEPRTAVEGEFSTDVVDALVDRGFLAQGR